MKSTIFHTALFAAAGATVAAAALFSATDAHAGRSSQIYQQTYEFNQPMHGYEGRAAVGNKYCSYKRFPIRKCWPTSDGGEKCRIVKWQLEQTCY